MVTGKTANVAQFKRRLATATILSHNVSISAMNHGLLPFATHILQHFGYLGLGLGLAISTLGLFSSEVFLLLAGLAWRQGSMSFAIALIVVLAGQMLGGLISYAIGRYGGVPLLTRYGRYVLLSHKDLERAHRWFQRYGRAATVLGYCLPLIRGYIGYAAGIAEESPSVFTASLAIGATIWSILIMLLGYLLADHLGAVEQVLQPISYLLLVAVVVALAFFIRHRWKERLT